MKLTKKILKQLVTEVINESVNGDLQNDSNRLYTVINTLNQISKTTSDKKLSKMIYKAITMLETADEYLNDILN